MYIDEINESEKKETLIYIASLVVLLRNVFHCLINFISNEKFKEEFKTFYCFKYTENQTSPTTIVSPNKSCKKELLVIKWADLDHMRSTEV